MPFNNVNNEDKKSIIKIRAAFEFCLFPKSPAILGVTSDFGITKFVVNKEIEGSVHPNKDGCIIVKGNFSIPLERGQEYTLVLTELTDSRYGLEYNLLYISQYINFKSLTGQRKFIKTIVSENLCNALYETLENPMQAIMDHDIETLVTVPGFGEKKARMLIDKFVQKEDDAKIYIELADYNFSEEIINKIKEVYNSPDKIVDVIKNHPYDLIKKVKNIGFKKADVIALKGGISLKSVERIEGYIVFFLEEKADKGDSYVTAGELMVNLYNDLGGKEEVLDVYYDSDHNSVGSNIKDAITNLVSEDIITVEDDENKSRRRVYLNKYYNLESKIADHLKRLLNAGNEFKYDNWEEKVKALEGKQGFQFAPEQLEGIKLGLDKQVCLISGLAGSGKSSLVSGILAALPEYSFAQCALSGKAAARLQEVTGKTGSTIHRLLSYDPSLPGFAYNEENKLPYDIIILDEVSLVGGGIFLSLIKAIRNGTKLIMLGDMGQLESIGALNLAADIFNSDIIPTVELTQVHRQAAKSGIITSSHSVRNQELMYDSSFEGIDIRGELQDMIFDVSLNRLGNKDKALNWFKEYYNGDLVEKDIMKIQLISPVKTRGDSCVLNLNLAVQELVNPIKDNDFAIPIGTTDKPCSIHLGDKVMCIKNNYKTKDLMDIESPIYNGWVGIVKDIKGLDILVDFPLAENIIKVPIKSVKDTLVLGYASTVHKLQGSDAPVVIGVIDFTTPPNMLTCQLLYTLITRAKKKCIVVAESRALAKATQTDFVSTKRTFLKELLKKQDE